MQPQIKTKNLHTYICTLYIKTAIKYLKQLATATDIHLCGVEKRQSQQIKTYTKAKAPLITNPLQIAY